MSTKRSRVLLMEDIPQLGKAGEIVEVAPGYARNYLLPLHKAAVPSDESLRQLQGRRSREQAEKVAKAEAMKELAEKIPGTNVTIEMKVSPDGKLYGSVTAAMIAQAMQDAGLDISPQAVRLEHAIKEIGHFDVPIHVYGDIEVQARIWVVSAPD